MSFNAAVQGESFLVSSNPLVYENLDEGRRIVLS